MRTAQVFSCRQRSRVALLEESPNAALNGIDYLELLSASELEVFFVRPIAPPGDWRNFVRVEGGVRFPDPKVVSATAVGNKLSVSIAGPTDASEYVLKLVASPLSENPPANVDPILSSVNFSFRSMCPSDFDPKPVHDCADEAEDSPVIDYLAKDYNSFRQLMLDRLALLMPHGVEKSPADLQMALVEVLAYAGDYLSYAQDAAATEAYLGTARLRTSLRRHARHLDYQVDDGQNARAWVFFSVVADFTLPANTALVTCHDADTVLDDDAFLSATEEGHLVFETMEPADLSVSLNEIPLYTWGDRDCCLAQGSTAATLTGTFQNLKPGMPLLFEEIRSPQTGEPADADTSHRHVVRLTWVDADVADPIDGTEVTKVEWHVDDALPFPLLLEHKESGAATVVARGNLVLTDHGHRESNEVMDDPATDGRVRLRQGPVTRAARALSRTGLQVRGPDNKPLRFDPDGPASTALDPKSNVVVPEIEVIEPDVIDPWLPQSDLLRSSKYTREFVVESETGGLTWLRFGDGSFGMVRPEHRGPDEKDKIKVSYRVGNGSQGNVGADSITHVHGSYMAIEAVRNPLPAKGGRDPEPAEAIRTYAPLAFQTQQRAVTEADYTTVLGWHPDVQRAKALRRWTGSWYTMIVLVDRKAGKRVDDDFKREIIAYLERFRMAGIDVEVSDPTFVPLDIAMTVCVESNAIRSEVKRELLRTFSTAPGGFFDPDAWTFNTDVSLSAIIERAMRVTGVRSVDFSSAQSRFQRYGRAAANEIKDGVILISDQEVARLDNSVLFPEYGRIEFFMEGGR